MENERISREVVIANRSYPLKIYKKDEKQVLNTVNQINQKIESLKARYDAKDNQDYLVMCLLQIATQDRNQVSNNITTPSGQAETDDLEFTLNEIESMLDAVT